MQNKDATVLRGVEQNGDATILDLYPDAEHDAGILRKPDTTPGRRHISSLDGQSTAVNIALRRTTLRT